MQRTTLLLDDEARRAARELALKLDCSVSEAIRRAVVGYRDHLTGASPAVRAQRKRAVKELIGLFDGNDARAELRRLKSEDL